MKRLTTDYPDGNFETVLNYVYGKDGVAYLRSDGERDDVPLHEWAKKQCIARGCDEFPGETLEEIDETICDCAFDFPDCPVFLAYTFACQAVHLRDRLKRYEDTGLMPDDVERLAAQEPNAPLTLEELRGMDGEPVWNDTMKKWALVDLGWEFGPRTVDETGQWRDLGDRYYRRKPEEAAP